MKDPVVKKEIYDASLASRPSEKEVNESKEVARFGLPFCFTGLTALMLMEQELGKWFTDYLAANGYWLGNYLQFQIKGRGL